MEAGYPLLSGMEENGRIPAYLDANVRGVFDCANAAV